MPKCKNCGARLSKFDKDICPVCGTQRPLDGVVSETVEITSSLDLNNPEFKDFKPRTKLKTFLLSAFIGWTGAQFIYLHLFKWAIVWFCFNCLLEVGMGFLFTYSFEMGFVWGFIVPIFVIYVINIIMGLFLFLTKNLKDGDGEFLR